MGAGTRHESSRLIADLIQQPDQYSFYRALDLLKSHLGSQHTHRVVLSDYIRLQPASEISFPASDIRRGDIDFTGKIQLELNFMGLYGVDSPLPQHFNDAILRNRREENVLMPFMAFLNQRIYWLFYEVWKKYHPYQDKGEVLHTYDRVLTRIAGLSGTCADKHTLRHAAHFGSAYRNVDILRKIVSTALDGKPVQIRENVPEWVELRQSQHLGGKGDQALALGVDTRLGTAILDVSGKLAITIGPLLETEGTALLENEAQQALLHRLIKRYVGSSIQYELHVTYELRQKQPLKLGQDGVRLGYNMLIGTPGKTLCTKQLFHSPQSGKPEYQKAGSAA